MARKGIVVETHPEDHSVDLVMLDDGARLVGVKVMAYGASTRTGTVDLPAIPAKKDKWDITKRTGQEVEAVVGYIGRQPYVAGFFFPARNKMLWKDKLRRLFRHQSDVSQFIDGAGNFQMDWPNGLYLRVGESPDREDTDSKNFAGNAVADRNTGKQYHARLGLPGGAGTITVTPQGKVRFEIAENFEVTSEKDAVINVKNATVTAEEAVSVTAKTASVTAQEGASVTAASADVESEGALTVKAASMTFDTPIANFTGKVTAAIDMVAAGVSLVNHPHDRTMPAPPGTMSGPPLPTDAPAPPE